MRGGDLSNEAAPILGIRFERVIKTDEGKLNRAAKAYMESLPRSVDVNIYVITTWDERRTMAFLTKWGVPYSKVIKAETLLEIPDIVRAHDMLTYYDLDKDVLQNVNSRGSGKVDVQLWTLGIHL